MKQIKQAMAFLIVFSIILFSLEYCISKKKSGNTNFVIKNNTEDTVTVFLTLSGQADKNKYVQTVNGIFGIKDTGLVGAFYLAGGDSVSYQSLKYFSGNIAFGAQPVNCPDSLLKTGINIFEFNLNEPQESIDISTIAGVNCFMAVELIGGPEWAASPSYPDVRSFSNDSIYKNTDRVGVYPYGCTTCTDTTGKQACQNPAEKPSSGPICNPTRAKDKRGGTVKLIFNGYSN